MKRIGALDATSIWIPGETGLHEFKATVHTRAIHLLFSMADAYQIDELWVLPSFGSIDDGDSALWDIQPMAADRPWYHGFRPGVHGDGINVVFPGLDDRAGWHRAETAPQLLSELNAYNTALGIDYSWSPSHTGSALIRQECNPRHLAVPTFFPGVVANKRAAAREMAWIRALTESEAQCVYLHSFDKNGAYVAAAVGELGIHDCTYRGPLFYHKGEKVQTPGYFNIRGYDVPLDMPDVFDPDGYYRIHPEKDVWVTAPALNAMLEHSAVDIESSYVWPEHARVLAPWQARIRDARTSLMTNGRPLALETLKDTYTATLGMLGSGLRSHDTNNPLYRPDWRHMIIGQSTANTWRRIVKAITNGVSVVAAAADCIYVVSDTADPRIVAMQAGISLGTELRDCKVQDSVRLDTVQHCFGTEYMAGYGTRKLAIERLRKALGGTGVDEAVEV